MNTYTTRRGLCSRSVLSLALSAAALSISLGSAHAQIVNGSFEDSGGSFNGWLGTGAVSIKTSSFTAPTDGTFQAFVSNASGSVSAADLSTFFGGVALPGNTQGPAFGGSGIRQTFTLSTNVTLSFDYKYVTQEDIGSGFDETFYILDGTITLLADPDTAGVAPIGGLPVPYANGLPYLTVNINLLAGTHTLGFGAYDTDDGLVDTALLIDQVGVPEPSTWTSLALGMAGLISRRRRRSSSAG